MTSEANPHYFATNTKDDTSIDQITDAVDFPHTGLIKALSLGMKGNYAVKGSATDFDITQASTGNVLQVAAGKIYRDGSYETVNAANFTNTSFDETANTHHLLVADSSNTLQIRKHSSSTQNAIPPYDEGDTIIAIVTYTSNGFDDMTIQYLTTGKVANSVSIGYSSGSSPNEVYNEAGALTGDSNGITMTGLYKLDTLPTATVASDDKVVIQDTSDSDKIKTVTASAIAGTATDVVQDTSPQLGGNLDVNSYSIVSDSGNENIVIAPHGTGQVVIGNQTETVNRLTSNGARDLKLEANSGVGASITIEDGTNADIIISPNGTGSVGIGTTSPDAPLHVETSGSGDAIIVESTDAGSTDAPDVIFYRNSASPAANDEIGSIRFRGKDSAAGDKDYNRITSVIRDTTAASADADLIFKSLSNSVEIEMMKISRIDGIVINEIGASYIDTRIESDNKTHMFFVDASADKVGIGNSSPDATLDVEDGGTFRSTRLLTVSISTATTLTEADHAGRYLLCSANVTLPSTSSAGEHYTILNTSGSDITIGRNGNNINGAGSDATVSTYNGATCIAIGSNNWIVIGV